MGIKYKDIENIEYNRKIEIIERAIFIENKFKTLIESKRNYGMAYIVQTLYYQYRKFYQDNLNEAEKALFNTFVMFPHEETFKRLIERYNKDFKKISDLYCVTETYVKLRYYIGISIENEKKDIKTLEKNNPN